MYNSLHIGMCIKASLKEECVYREEDKLTISDIWKPPKVKPRNKLHK